MTPSHSDQWDAQLEQKRLQVAAEQVLEQAKVGAEQVDFGAGSSQGLNVTVRNGQCEVLEYQKDRSLGVTLWVNGQKGSASSSDLSAKSYRPVLRRPSISRSIPSQIPTAGWQSLSCWHSKRRICHSIMHGIWTVIRPLSWLEPLNKPPLKCLVS